MGVGHVKVSVRARSRALQDILLLSARQSFLQLAKSCFEVLLAESA